MDLTDLMNKKLEQAETYNNLGLATGLASSFADVAGSFVDYSTLIGNAADYYIQAGNVELQAKERANMLRQQYISAAGNYIQNAAMRGINVNSGSVRSNLESSAINMGQDIQTMNKNAKMQAKALRSQAKISDIAAKGSMLSGVFGGISSMSGSVASYYSNKEIISSLKK